MKKITHIRYKNYPEQPYISPNRNIESWERSPELFPYSVVERKQMQRLPEGLLPGDVVMLWRIGINNFTNETVIPQYFEYKYGVDSDESIQTLISLNYVEICNASDSLDCLNMIIYKRLLAASNLETKGKRDELLNRIIDNIPEQVLSKQFTLRKYKITKSGKQKLEKYDAIIQKHGPKM